MNKLLLLERFAALVALLAGGLALASASAVSEGCGQLPKKCADVCPLYYKPVCGTDGVTYGNTCELQRAACKHSEYIRQAHEGPCGGAAQEDEPTEGTDEAGASVKSPPRLDACATVRCGYGASCQVQGGRAKCVCLRERCPNNIQGVCGTDGRTYATECDMRREACERKEGVQVAHQGACRNGESASE